MGGARATPMALVDSTSSYFAQMGAVPLLSAAAELALARRIERGDRRIFATLLGSVRAVDELLRVAAEGTTTRTPARDVFVDVDARHVGFDEAARKRELGELVAVLQRYRDAQERHRDVAAARRIVLARFCRQWFRARVLAHGVAVAPVSPALTTAVAMAEDARAAMLRANLRLVVSVARRYRERGVDLLDLVQEGNLGLMTAIDKFDHRRGYRLATYATWWIRVAVSRAVAEEPRTIHVPASMRGQMSRVARARSELTRTLGRPPVEDEVADRAGISLDRLRRVRAVPGEPLSLETPAGFDDDSATLQDFCEDPQAASPAQALYARALTTSVHSALSSALTDREAMVVRMRFGIGTPSGQTLEEISHLYGVTRERIRQIEERALGKLRRPRVAAALRPHFEA